MKALLRYKGKFINFGLFVLRLGIGFMFIMHGLPKIQAGSETWAEIGSAVMEFGIDKYHTVFGLLAALTEVGGGFLLLAGLLFKPACIALLTVMIVAANLHLSHNEGLLGASHAIELGIVLLSL